MIRFIKKAHFCECNSILIFMILTCTGCAHYPEMTVANEDRDHYVVLLHGLARSDRSMVKIQKELAERGYGTCNISYPSTKFPIQTLLDDYVLPAMNRILQIRIMFMVLLL